MRALSRSHLGRVARRILPATAMALALGGALTPNSAQAQFFGGWDGGWGGGWGSMGPGQIYESIAQRGFRVYGPLRRNGSVYIADVIDRRGRHERLILAAADGEILQRFILDDPRLPSSPPRNAYALPQDDGEQPVERADRGDLVPPASIPDGGASYGNRDNTAVEPVRPPQARRIRPVRPRVVDRTPEQPSATRREAIPSRNVLRPKRKEPLRIHSESATAKRPSEPPVKSASRPTDTPEKPSVPAPTPAPTTTTKLTDPLAIPGGEPKTERHPAEAPKASAAAAGTQSAPRIVPGNVTGAPAPVQSAPPASASPPPAVAAPPAKSDVPVAPLD